MYIGYMGDVVFVTSSNYLLTPSNFQRSGEGRWEEHDLIMKKPVSQFKGAGLEKISFKLQLQSKFNVSPRQQLRRLRQMRDTGAVFPLVIGGQPVTQNYWRLDSISEEDNYYSPLGVLIETTVSVSLTEYDDSNYTEEKTMIGKLGTGINAVSALFGG